MNVEDGYKCKGGMSTNVNKDCSSRMDTNVMFATASRFIQPSSY